MPERPKQLVILVRTMAPVRQDQDADRNSEQECVEEDLSTGALHGEGQCSHGSGTSRRVKGRIVSTIRLGVR